MITTSSAALNSTAPLALPHIRLYLRLPDTLVQVPDSALAFFLSPLPYIFKELVLRSEPFRPARPCPFRQVQRYYHGLYLLSSVFSNKFSKKYATARGCSPGVCQCTLLYFHRKLQLPERALIVWRSGRPVNRLCAAPSRRQYQVYRLLFVLSIPFYSFFCLYFAFFSKSCSLGDPCPARRYTDI